MKKQKPNSLTRKWMIILNYSKTCVVFDFPEKPESNQSGVAVENAKEFSDVSDFILNINNKTCLWETTRLLPQQKKRVQKVWSNKQKVIIIVNSSALTYYLESVSSDNALFEFEDSSDLLQWLENCTDPWDTVESHWIRTAGTRLKLVKNTNAPASVYINKYPALKKPTGYILGCEGAEVDGGFIPNSWHDDSHPKIWHKNIFIPPMTGPINAVIEYVEIESVCTKAVCDVSMIRGPSITRLPWAMEVAHKIGNERLCDTFDINRKPVAVTLNMAIVLAVLGFRKSSA
ncbi:hypothetical protein EVAR_95040_1 [Eumeta japonica]|uniref:Uncharacterized protein n=1 Tax=Eumeta variegata TaxID=151549 RepID=A0A4C1VU59_EUMVA|nr:hypothetical protein EVAR_95040_1 [Eumeta japonica]